MYFYISGNKIDISRFGVTVMCDLLCLAVVVVSEVHWCENHHWPSLPILVRTVWYNEGGGGESSRI